MPHINLLSPGTSAKKIETKIIPSAVSKINIPQILPGLLGRCAVCTGAIVVVWLILAFQISIQEKKLSVASRDTEGLSAYPSKMEAMKKEKEGLEKKALLIDQLSSRQFFWYEKLDLISFLIPQGVWLTDISLRKEKMSAKEMAALKGVGIEQKTILVVRGTAVAYKIEDAVGLVGSFIHILQGNEQFAKGFKEIKLNTATKGTLGGLDVMRFDLFCEVK